MEPTPRIELGFDPYQRSVITIILRRQKMVAPPGSAPGSPAFNSRYFPLRLAAGVKIRGYYWYWRVDLNHRSAPYERAALDH